MTSAKIRQQIRYYTNLLEETREDRRTIEQNLSAVRTLAENRRKMYDQMNDDLAIRRNKLNGSSIDINRVRIMKNLSQGLEGLLSQGNIHLTRLAEQKYQIARAESDLEDRARACSIKERNYVNTIADLRRQLSTAEAEEAIQNA